MIAKVPPASQKRGAALPHGHHRHREPGQPVEHLFGSGLISHQHDIHAVVRRPPADQSLYLGKRDHLPRHHASWAADRHPALLPAGIDRQHPHRKVSTTGPMV